MLGLSLVMCVRDESPWIEDAIGSVGDYVDEVVVLDTGSSDDTFERCLRMGARGVKIQTVFGTFDFGQAKTAVSWMAEGAFVLLLDADERLTGAKYLLDLVDLMDARNWQAVGLPRRRWADIQMSQQVERIAYPDWQARLYRNNRRQIRWNGALHETLSVKAENVFFPKAAPIHIEHFVDPLHLADVRRRDDRARQRANLARIAGVPVEGSEEAKRRAEGGS